MAKLEYQTAQIAEQLTNVPISGAGDDNCSFSAVINGACHSVSEGQNAGNNLMLISDLHGSAARTTQFNTIDQKIALDKAIFAAVGSSIRSLFRSLAWTRWLQASDRHVLLGAATYRLWHAACGNSGHVAAIGGCGPNLSLTFANCIIVNCSTPSRRACHGQNRL